MKKQLLFYFVLLVLSFTARSQTLSFTVNTDTIDIGDTITFTNTSTGFAGGQEFAWLTGDRCDTILYANPDSCVLIKTTLTAFTHIYNAPGVYSIVLRSRTAGVLSNSRYVVTIYVRQNPVPPLPPDCGLIRNGDFDEGIGVNTMLPTYQANSIANAAPWDKPFVTPKNCVTLATYPQQAVFASPLLMNTNPFGPWSNHLPGNSYFYQDPYSGTGATMIITRGGTEATPYSATYAQQKLSYPLIPGEQYFLSFRASLGDQSGERTNLSAYFTQTQNVGTVCADVNSQVITSTGVPQVNSGILADKNNYSLVKGYFTGAGEKFITIGRFDYTGAPAVEDIPGMAYQFGCVYVLDSVRLTPKCCVDADYVVSQGQSTATDIINFFGTGSVIQNKRIYVGVDLTIDANITFQGCELIMRNNVNINIPASRTMTVTLYTSGMFSLQSQIYSGCDAMWNSINLQAASSQLIMNNTVIKDGKAAVYSGAGGVFTINNCTFDKNYIAIKVQNGGNFGGVLWGNTFKCSQNISLSPYAGQTSFAGVQLISTTNMNIGNASQTQNIFTGIQTSGTTLGLTYGVTADKSGMTAYNNTFKYNQYGIYSVNSNLSPVIPFSQIGNNGVSTQLNTFTNCLTGVYTNGRHQLEIIANNFNTQTTPLNIALNAISVNDPLQYPVNIRENIIYDYNTGIVAQNVTYGTGDVSITRNTVYQVTGSLNNMRMGIYIGNLSSADGLNNVYVANNTVGFGNVLSNSYITTCSGCVWTGIRAYNCNQAYLFNNNIKRTTNEQPNAAVLDKLVGIQLELDNRTQICSNTIRRFGCGVRLTGSNPTSAYKLSVMDSCWNMYRFNNAINILTQGTASIPFDNQMFYQPTGSTNRMSGTFNVSGSTFSWFYKTSASQYNITPVSVSPSYLTATPCTTSNTITCPTSTGRLASEDTTSDTGDEELINNLADIVNDDIAYVNNADESRYIDKTFAYRLATTDASLSDENTPDEIAIGQFVNAAQNANIGLIDSLNVLASVADTVAFAALNAQLQPQNTIEGYRKTVNGIYAASWMLGRYELTAEETDILTPIALSDPLINGDAVYSARVLLNITGNVVSDTAGVAERSAIETKEFVTIYPNPATGSVNVAFNFAESKTGMFYLYSIDGRLAKTDNFNGTQGVKQIDLSGLPQGLFFYKIVAGTEVIQNGKLIVTKN